MTPCSPFSLQAVTFNTDGGQTERNDELIAQYHVDVPDDEQMDFMCIFLLRGASCMKPASFFTLSSLPPRLSEFFSIGPLLFDYACRSFSMIQSCYGLENLLSWKDRCF